MYSYLQAEFSSKDSLTSNKNTLNLEVESDWLSIAKSVYDLQYDLSHSSNSLTFQFCESSEVVFSFEQEVTMSEGIIKGMCFSFPLLLNLSQM